MKFFDKIKNMFSKENEMICREDLVESIYWQVMSIYLNIIPSRPNIRIHKVDKDKTIYLTFDSDLGAVEITLDCNCPTLPRCYTSYKMIYQGANGKSMFTIKRSVIKPEPGFTPGECLSAAEELNNYLACCFTDDDDIFSQENLGAC